MNELKIPMAITNRGDLVHIDNAERDVDYLCPACGTLLLIKQGEVRTRHFSHPATSSCSTESVQHILAKRLLMDAIQANSDGKQVLHLLRSCSTCGIQEQVPIPEGTFSSSDAEVPINGFIVDVVGYRKEGAPLGIEVYHSHRVSPMKKRHLSIPWIELLAIDVIETPFQWNPTQFRLKNYVCTQCRNPYQVSFEGQRFRAIYGDEAVKMFLKVINRNIPNE